MPVPGDVDIVVASELMEAGRAIQRGFVTPDRTTLVASTHRVYAMTERIALADGRVDDAAHARRPAAAAAQRLVAFDMAAIAERDRQRHQRRACSARSPARGRCRSRARPSRPRSGAAASASPRACRFGPFEAQEDASAGGEASAPPARRARPAAADPRRPGRRQSRGAAGRARAARPRSPGGTRPARAGTRYRPHGVARCADYQDDAYARLYLEPVRGPRSRTRAGDGTGRLLAETARQLALGMAYEDTIRVAELKIRAGALRPGAATRCSSPTGRSWRSPNSCTRACRRSPTPCPPASAAGSCRQAGPKRPRAPRRARARGEDEHCRRLPPPLPCRRSEAAAPPLAALRRRAGGRSTPGCASSPRPRATATTLAAEVAECRKLVKGYGETHARGRERFERLMAALPKLSAREDAAARLDNLRKAANADETGETLNNALAALTPR